MSALQASAGSRFDDASWTAQLAKYVGADSRVDYSRWKKDGTQALDAYIGELARPWPADLNAAERKAALINAYNALTIRWILRNYPEESIWRTSHPFTAKRQTLDGAKVSLHDIETSLRNMGDPRIHGAIVYGARSCPPLRREAYAAGRIDAQLDNNMRAWLSLPALNRIDPLRRRAAVSMIFYWYKQDFDNAAGSVQNFIARFADVGKDPLRISYQPFQWGLNDTSDLGLRYTYSDFVKDKLRDVL